MNRTLATLALTLLAGCNIGEPDLSYTRPEMTGAWDTTYLLDATPALVTKEALAEHAALVEEHYWSYAQVNGICWPPMRTDGALEHPDSWVSGGDSALFTGYGLAAAVWRYRVTGEGLSRIVSSLEGLYLLTHVTGTRGVIARCAFPAEEKTKFYYNQWGSRIERGFVGVGDEILSPLRPGVIFPPQVYYTRATKDQLSGILFGLAVTWSQLEPMMVELEDREMVRKIRDVVATITQNVYDHLQKHNWTILDEKGENDTNSKHVSGLLRVSMLALYRKTATITHPDGVLKAEKDYGEELDSFLALANILIVGDRFNNFDQYYGHNLRVTRSYAVWVLGDQHDKKKIHDYFKSNVWSFVKGHQNAWFAYIGAAMGSGSATEGFAALQSLSLKPLRGWSSPLKGQEIKPSLAAATANCTAPYVKAPHLRKPTKYSSWQKEPWDVGDGEEFDKEGRNSVTGVGFLSSYWLARYHQLLD